MNVRVQIDLSVPAARKHLDEMRSSADLMTDNRKSVRVSVPPDNPKSMIAAFTIPKVGQMDVVEKIMRRFALSMENYQDQTIWFPEKPRKRKPRRAQPESDRCK